MIKITEVESLVISIPLKEPVAFATSQIDRRDHVIVKVHTGEGITGTGYSLGYYGGPTIAKAVDELLKPLLLGKDPLDTEKLWEEMFNHTVKVGRKGVLLRGISCVDIALWDIKGKVAGLPLYKLLGGYRDKVPAYASGGYYKKGKGINELIAEVTGYVEKGFNMVKIKVGKLSMKEEVERVKAVRKALGDDVELLLDANGAWKDASTAIRICKRFEEYTPYWIEEPVMPDNLTQGVQVAAALDMPVATGEQEFTRWGFAELVKQKAADILQPDATVVGGISEWMKVAHMASTFDIPVAPHYNWDLHAHLVAATANSLFVEYFFRESDIKVLDDVLKELMRPENGYLTLPDRPGHGIEFDEKKLKAFRIS